MNGDRQVLTRAVARALSGRSAHIEPSDVFVGLDWKIAGTRPRGVAHSVFQLLNHMVFWQNWVISWLEGKKPENVSGSWRGSDGPASRGEWERAVGRFRSGIDELNRCCREADLLAKRGKTSRLEMLQTAASHNSYHAGQVVILRQMLGTWADQRSRRASRARETAAP